MAVNPDRLDLQEPFIWYRSMREATPVARDPRNGGWMVFSYSDVQRVLSDHEHFSSALGRMSIVHTDPPRHRKLRNLVTQAFTPRAVEALRPRIEQITHDLLDQVSQLGEMDLMRDLAVPLPVIVIAEMLGIPIEDRDRFKAWSDAIVTVGDSALDPRQAQLEMRDYFGRLVDERRRQPREDLISALLAARLDGEALDQFDLLAFCILLLIAGNETTTNLLGNAILCFDENPESDDALRADPALLPMAIEEVLRYRSPVQGMMRRARSRVVLSGQVLSAGEMVMAFIGSANHDPAQFPDPDRFNVARLPNRHLAFGQGIHFCLGAPLARLEGAIALDALRRRLGALRVDRTHPIQLVNSHIIYGVRSLRVTFDPAAA
ncbi:MAG: cytochrome P450 [Candidatus Dormibacteraeota bacterium]|nr:cytochrome P450 [Candidatus Dormibacteraeota bacterium]